MVNIEQRNGFGTRLKSLFNGRSTIARQSLPSSIVSPKSPAPRLGVSILASPRIDLPGLPSHLSPFPRSPTSTHLDHGGCSPPPATIAAPASALSRQDASPAFPLSPHLHCTTRSSPPSTWQWEHVRDSSGNTRRRRRRLREAVRPRGAKKSLLREKTGRLKLVRCLGLGLLLAVGLSVYLALALSGVVRGLQVHILMIVIGLLLVMAFAHATVRLGMYILRPPQYPLSRTTSHSTVKPEEPIPIILRRDEEEFSDEDNEVPKDAALSAPPPAYGLWRGSTRMDPNLIHWRKVQTLQRQAEPLVRNSHDVEQPTSPYRPPSYATEDGVRYLINARPRSIAPEANPAPLPVHPSEQGRIAPARF